MRTSTTYKLAGTKTFRRSSCQILPKKRIVIEGDKEKVVKKGWGQNLQNIEKSMREPYEPDGFSKELIAKCSYWLGTGDLSVFTEEELVFLRVFVQVDQSGAEALIVAYDSEPKDYRQLFIHGIKPHIYVAAKLFVEQWKVKAREYNLNISDSTIDKIVTAKIHELKSIPEWKEFSNLISDSDNWALTERYYYLAKQTVHSANYDIQWSTFRMNILEKSGGKIVIDKKQAEFFLQMYRGLFPEIPESNERIKRQVEETGIIYNLFGMPYKITLYDPPESKMKEFYAWPRQSTVGEITRIAFSNEQAYIEQNNKQWDLLADTHDSTLTQCPLIDVKECIRVKQECMNQRLVSPVDGVEFNMKSEAQVGFNWAPQKKNNLVGLRVLKWN